MTFVNLEKIHPAEFVNILMQFIVVALANGKEFRTCNCFHSLLYFYFYRQELFGIVYEVYKTKLQEIFVKNWPESKVSSMSTYI